MNGIPSGAGVRHRATDKVGRTFRNAHGAARGHIFVQWDGERHRKTIAVHDVALVSTDYETANSWEAAEARGDVQRAWS